VKAYIAAAMFSQAEKEFNLAVDAAICAAGLRTYLPQRDGGEAAALVRQGDDEDMVRRQIFNADRAAIRDCDVLVFILDGRVPDEGGCVELGMASALGKPCLGFQTDCRRFGGTDSNNLMIDYALDLGIARSVDQLTTALRRLLAGAGHAGEGEPGPDSRIPERSRP
jgi:nucleoside 2-deoxyribosyltransferase